MLDATPPIDSSSPAWRRRCPNTEEVYCLGSVGAHHGPRFEAAPQTGDLHAVDDEGGRQFDLFGHPTTLRRSTPSMGDELY